MTAEEIYETVSFLDTNNEKYSMMVHYCTSCCIEYNLPMCGLLIVAGYCGICKKNHLMAGMLSVKELEKYGVVAKHAKQAKIR